MAYTKQSIYISLGLAIMIMVSIVFTYTAISEVNRLILEGREIGNKRGNQTLGAVGTAIDEIKIIEGELRDNLTQHRLVANQTNSQVQELIAQFNQTNEEERVKAVDKILEALSNNTEKLDELLSVQN